MALKLYIRAPFPTHHTLVQGSGWGFCGRGDDTVLRQRHAVEGVLLEYDEPGGVGLVRTDGAFLDSGRDGN